jgi:hypothetical protein
MCCHRALCYSSCYCNCACVVFRFSLAEDDIEIIKDSRKIDAASLNQNKCSVQVTMVTIIISKANLCLLPTFCVRFCSQTIRYVCPWAKKKKKKKNGKRKTETHVFNKTETSKGKAVVRRGGARIAHLLLRSVPDTMCFAFVLLSAFRFSLSFCSFRIIHPCFVLVLLLRVHTATLQQESRAALLLSDAVHQGWRRSR